ncbi:MAG: hybrid sensor histidine kinase/response regulator [gamma proteobacterium endosymbiont of Lamellibrachia anaximandri]|nr:hybrid sensor histidine kinase/response regulator [gamma proteobacterium endosymbiont of Lamellibrachia anaximandri]
MSDHPDSRMLQALTGHILRHRKTSYIAITAAQILMLIGLWSAYSHFILLLWFFSMQAVALPHFIISQRYAGRELTSGQIGYIKIVFIVYTLISSTLWGSLTWLLTGTWDIHAFIVLMPMLGIFAGAINLAAILPIYFCLVTPILLQSLAVFLFTEAANPLLAGLFAIYYAGMIKFAVELHKMLVHTYSLQFELESANDELVVQKQTAEKANIDKSRFLAAASHDLRQPLYAMELFLGGLSLDRGRDNRVYLLSRLRNALDSMQEMFSSLLDMSRFDAGVISPMKINIFSNQLLQSLKYKFDDECNRKGIRLIVRPSNHWVYSDPILIQRVLENYISNAVKYTDSGGVLVACRRHGEGFRFEVWDTGKGIRQEEMNSIFDAFHQLDNPERDRRKGVGLGLSIVDQIASLLETPVCVRSQHGKGSVFCIDVPKGKAEAVPLVELDDNALVDDDVFVDLVVWVVDDDIDILEGLQLQLETWGCITRTFESLKHVQAVMTEDYDSPDLLISDLRLRAHKSGIEVIEIVRQHSKNAVSAILITGDTGQRELQKISKAGVPLLHKPVTAEKLRLTMAKLLKSVKDISAVGE